MNPLPLKRACGMGQCPIKDLKPRRFESIIERFELFVYSDKADINNLRALKKQLKGYSINQRMDRMEHTLFEQSQKLAEHDKKIDFFIKTSLPPVEGVFYDGQLDLQRHNAQYEPIDIRPFNRSHDRFLIIDEKELYHIGTSLKDLGKKWFAFSSFPLNMSK